MAIHSSGEVQGADWHGKLTTTLMYITMTAHLVFPNIPGSISVAMTVLCTCMILVSGVLYGIRNIRCFRTGKLEEGEES